jgi:hypothetical protein
MRRRIGPVPYTQRERSEAAARLTIEQYERYPELINVKRSIVVGDGERYGISQIAIAVNRNLPTW